jgi:hypothetical protein
MNERPIEKWQLLVVEKEVQQINWYSGSTRPSLPWLKESCAVRLERSKCLAYIGLLVRKRPVLSQQQDCSNEAVMFQVFAENDAMTHFPSNTVRINEAQLSTLFVTQSGPRIFCVDPLDLAAIQDRAKVGPTC